MVSVDVKHHVYLSGSEILIFNSSVQFKTESVRSENLPPRLSDVFPALPLKRVQHSSDGRWTFFVFSTGDRRALPLSTPLSSRRSMAWYPWQCACSYCLKLLNASDLPRHSPVVMAAFPASLSARSFPLSPACLGHSKVAVEHRHTGASLDFPFCFGRFVSNPLNLWLRKSGQVVYFRNPSGST